MSKFSGTGMRRTWSAALVALLLVLSARVWMMIDAPQTTGAAPITGAAVDLPAVTAKLEQLHERAVARTRAEEDDDYDDDDEDFDDDE